MARVTQTMSEAPCDMLTWTERSNLALGRDMLNATCLA